MHLMYLPFFPDSREIRLSRQGLAGALTPTVAREFVGEASGEERVAGHGVRLRADEPPLPGGSGEGEGQ